jgi:hypothetical protein
MSRRFHVQIPDEADVTLARIARDRGMSKAGLARWVLLRFIREGGAPRAGPHAAGRPEASRLGKGLSG